jgi:hypothetical protein
LQHASYITNVSPDVLSPEDIARLYSARWEVELIFKELKNFFRMDQIPSRKEHVVEALLYSAILSLIVSRSLLKGLQRKLRLAAERCPARRWAAVLFGVAKQILGLLISPNVHLSDWKRLECYLHHELLDPNVRRARNLDILRA